jgi:hypothetical protein
MLLKLIVQWGLSRGRRGPTCRMDVVVMREVMTRRIGTLADLGSNTEAVGASKGSRAGAYL